MKVLSLLQPWATLVVIGAKKIETRPWNTSFRGELLIHASAGKYMGLGKNKISCRELCYKDPFKKYINGAYYDNLPFGGIIGKVNLSDTILFGSDKAIDYLLNLNKEQAKEEIAFGDYSEGRYGFIMSNAVEFTKSFSCKGSLSLWNCPIEIENKILHEQY